MNGVTVSLGRTYRVSGNGWSVSVSDRGDAIMARVLYNRLVARDLWGELSNEQRASIQRLF